MPLFPLQSSSFYLISFMVFSAVLTLVKLLVLCTGSTVRRESCSPVRSAGWALPWLAQRRCCKGWAHQESLATTLASAVCLSAQLLSKTHCDKKLQRFASETWPDYTQQRLRFPKQVWDSWHSRKAKALGHEAARSAGKPGGLPRPSSIIHQTPHPSSAPLAESLLWVWVG